MAGVVPAMLLVAESGGAQNGVTSSQVEHARTSRRQNAEWTCWFVSFPWGISDGNRHSLSLAHCQGLLEPEMTLHCFSTSLSAAGHTQGAPEASKPKSTSDRHRLGLTRTLLPNASRASTCTDSATGSPSGGTCVSTLAGRQPTSQEAHEEPLRPGGCCSSAAQACPGCASHHPSCADACGSSPSWNAPSAPLTSAAGG